MVPNSIVLDVVEDWPAAQVRNRSSGLVEFHQSLALGLDVVDAKAKVLEDSSSRAGQTELSERYLRMAEAVPSMNGRGLDGKSRNIARQDGLLVRLILGKE